MSRINRSLTQSPAFSRTERPFRSTTIGTSSPAIDPTNTARKNLLLSENQLNKISKKLAHIRHETLNEPDLPFQATSPVSRQAPPQAQPTFQTAHHAIGDFSVQIQEYAIIEDLLYVFMGITGNYIKCIYPKSLDNLTQDDDEQDDQMQDIQSEYDVMLKHQAWDSIEYTIDPTLDPSLQHLVKKILPLATYYVSIESFIDQYSRFEYGTVNHALCAGMRVFIKEYLTFVAQLEHLFQTSTQFTLQRLWFYAQDLLSSMKIMHDLCMCIRSVKQNQRTQEEEDDIEAVIEGLQAENSDEIIIPERQKGGAILNILSERLIGLSGNPKAKKMYAFLLSKASIPYFDILNRWIYHGEIRDPYNEFMVLEKRSVHKDNLKEDYNDTYWETRYTLREGVVPVFLESMKHQILLAGKFLNVVRECGVKIASPEEMQNEVLVQGLRIDSPVPANDQHGYLPTRSEVWAAVDGARIVKNLEIAYKYANQTLLNLLLKDQQLIGRLRSLKHYFFLDQSDFLTSFLDLAKDELNQPASEIPQARLQSLMDLVLRNPSSVAAYDPFKEDIKVSMSHLRLIDQLLRIINVSGMDSANPNTNAGASAFSHLSASLLSSTHLLERSQSLPNAIGLNQSHSQPLSGYEALTLDYTVTFPLSLVISRKALTKYQLLFRHILNLKHAEDLLCGVWMNQKDQLWRKRSEHNDIEQWKFRIYSLRHRMLMFVQQFTYYVTNEVLEPNWGRLEENLARITTVDQVLQYHSDFLDTCLKECMLTNSKLLRVSKDIV
ncbi:gamma-tubulin complex component protein [Choanephora cucurbitarum]|nr:gamma-tubulin complex component protein [Choanephora cucurbitarum]